MNRIEKSIRNPGFFPSEPMFYRGYEKPPALEQVQSKKPVRPASYDFIVEWQMNEPSSSNRKVS